MEVHDMGGARPVLSVRMAKRGGFGIQRGRIDLCQSSFCYKAHSNSLLQPPACLLCASLRAAGYRCVKHTEEKMDDS
jgi:hypothetical protein